MKPLKLEFEGIRSFSERAEIDFEKLSQNGLFGIFGPTGSGKSTILDAIIIALYGKMSRLGMAEIICTRCKKAFVNFEFSIVERGSRRIYRVERSFSLNKEGVYRNANAFLYEVQNGQLFSLAEKTDDVNLRIEEIIGLGANEFTKCIILPQGEFSQFVTATKTERIKIIEKLFDLEKYGDRFTSKLKLRINDLNLQLATKNGELSTLVNFTKEALDEAVKKQKEIQNEYNIQEEKLIKINGYIEKNKDFYVLNNNLLKDKEELYGLLKGKTFIDEKRKALELYEKAVKVKEAGEALDVAIVNESKQIKDFQDVSKEYEIVSLKMKDCEREFNGLDELSTEKNKAEDRKRLLLSAKDDVKRLNDIGLTVSNNEHKLESFIADKSNNLEKIAGLTEQKIKFEENIKEIEEKTDVAVAFSFAIDSALRKEFIEQIDYYNKQIEDILQYNDGSVLYGKVSGEYLKRRDEYHIKLNGIESGENFTAEEAIGNYSQMAEKKSNAESQVSKISIEIEKISGDNLRLDTEIKNCKEYIKRFTEERDSLIVKLNKTIGNIKDFDNELKMCEQIVSSLSKKESEIREKYKNITNELFDLRERKSKSEISSANLTKIKEEKEKAFNQVVDDEVKSISEAKKILTLIGDGEKLEIEIKEFDKRVEFLSESIKRMEERLSKTGFSSEDYLRNLQERDNIVRNRDELIKILGNYQNNVENLSQNFKERCIIEKDINILRSRVNVYERLMESVGKRAFAEFIASEFLSDVASEARKTLLELTGGKYDVKYKDSNNGKDGFFVLDNLNGGVERSVSSLSGGEIFLVSLALALSLSSNVYASSDKPMEFFFLDEGFGTLDDNLVDTVIDSLEKLKNKNFSIGLISHLAELKCRIDNKILVMPADETKGSSVKVLF